MVNLRSPAVAGMFYPGDPDALRKTVDSLLHAAEPAAAARPKALIAPHAGYVYSGPMAARAYAAVAPWAAEIRRVVLLGPTHRVATGDIVLPEAQALATPLGAVAVDAEAEAAIARLPQVTYSAYVHALEHSLEVHLPFLQRTIPHFALVPLAVGSATPEEVAEVIDRLWGGPETLFVVSSDLSHYLSYATAGQVDRDTCRHILDLDASIAPEQACGAFAINGLLLAARRRKLRPTLLGLCNSGDTAGDRERVVGYAAIAFAETEDDHA